MTTLPPPRFYSYSGCTAPCRLAFTLLELLVVLAIIGVLAGVLLASIQKVRAAAARTVCLNKEKQLILAVHLYADSFSGQLPPANYYTEVRGKAVEGGAFYAILPYLEQDAVFNAYTQDRPDAGYLGAQFVPLKIHVCPSDPTTNAGIATLDGKTATSNYALNLALFGAGGTFAVKGQSSPYPLGAIPDGASNTIGLVETSGCFPGSAATSMNFMSWPYPAYTNTMGSYWPNPDMLPGQANYAGNYPLPQFNITLMQADPTRCQSYHTGIMNIAMMDGSVRTISSPLSQLSWTHALDPADGLGLGSNW